ncbi:MAG: sugar transferase [Ignavibacteria bacterium]|nr:sugar transferase [Ignavibacteria bacterium]
MEQLQNRISIKFLNSYEAHYGYTFIKKSIDISLSLILLILLFPLLLLILFIVSVETKENPLFIQKRGLTLTGKIFHIYKIRTLKSEHHKKNIHSETVFIKPDYYTALTISGKFLRRTGLDELPQLINVLLGDMSFIGPRPLSLHDLNLLQKNEYNLYRRRENIKSIPGISGYWQIFGNRNAGLKNLIELDEYYDSNKCINLDIFLMMLTIPVVLFGKHSDAIANSETNKKYATTPDFSLRKK